MQLQGKKINIDSKEFLVQKHLLNIDENLETLILTRPIKKKISDIQELGFNNFKDFCESITEKDTQNILNSLAKMVDENIKISFVDESGKIYTETFLFKGRSIQNPQNFILEDEFQIEFPIPDIDIIRGYLLGHLWKN